MRTTDVFTEKIQRKIEIWFDEHPDEFIICLKEFCQGNRASLTPLLNMLEDLGSAVFAAGGAVNDDLLEQLEYKMFDLIGDYSSAPGGDALLSAINDSIVSRLTVIFADAKRRWNLHYYKITGSVETIDPDNVLIPDTDPFRDGFENEISPMLPAEIQKQARDIIDRLVLFAKKKFKGEKNRKIAVNWLENPEKSSDIRWLASLAGSSQGSAKVTLTRIKQSLARHHTLKRIGDRLTLDRVTVPFRRNCR